MPAPKPGRISEQVSLEHLGRDQQPASMASFSMSLPSYCRRCSRRPRSIQGTAPAGYPSQIDMKRSDPAYSVPRRPQLTPAPSPRARPLNRYHRSRRDLIGAQSPAVCFLASQELDRSTVLSCPLPAPQPAKSLTAPLFPSLRARLRRRQESGPKPRSNIGAPGSLLRRGFAGRGLNSISD